jgi:hypothetical protein
MPNWCSNRLIITGTEHALESFFSKANTDNGPFSMHAFVPRPDELSDTSSPSKDTAERRQELRDKYGTDNWYDWSIENWGTKWDIDAVVDLNAAEGEAEVTFDSAWGPPVVFVDRLAAMFPALHFVLEYAEGGMGFGGRRVYFKGSLTEEISTSESPDTRQISAWHARMIGADEDEEETDTNEEEDES